MASEPSETSEPQQDTISFNDFTKVKMRTGRVLEDVFEPMARHVYRIDL